MSGYKKTHTLADHSAGVTALAISPDRKHLATATADHTLHIWEVEGGTLLARSRGNTQIIAICWTTTTPYALLCGTESGNVITYSFSSHNTLDLLGFLAHRYPVDCIAVDLDLVATGAGDELRVWEWHSDRPWTVATHVLKPSIAADEGEEPEVLVTSVAWTPYEDGHRVLLAAYLHHGIQLFDGTTWSCTRTIAVDGAIVRANISTDRKFIAITNAGVGFDIYSLRSGQLARRFGPSGMKRALPAVFAERDRYLVCGSESGVVQVWDVFSGREVQSLKHHGHDKILAIDSSTLDGHQSHVLVTGVLDELQPYVVIWSKDGPVADIRATTTQYPTDKVWLLAAAVLGALTLSALMSSS